MKSFIVLFAVLSACTASADQRFNATPVARSGALVRIQVLTAKIERMNMDTRRLGFNDIQDGTVEIDTRFHRELVLTLNHAFHCPPGKFCSQLMLAPIVITLPLVSANRDSCGTVTYTATRDLRRVDGGLTTVELQDNRANRCESLARMAATHIILREVGARASFNEERVSTMSASPLVIENRTVSASGDPAVLR